MASGHDTMELEEGISKTTMKMVPTSQTICDPDSFIPDPVLPSHTNTPSVSASISFIKRKGRYVIPKQNRLTNSLLAGVGFLELANAGDFAANVWNEIPVPHFAAALMAVGATVALVISIFAFRDARLSQRNVFLLQQERSYLRTQKAKHIQDRRFARDIESRLAVNFREMGTELIDRVGMDIVMGTGAILVGVGTFMAIGGANPAVFMASNLLSGYIGNAPVALYGIANTLWSMFVLRRAYRHGIAGAKELEPEDELLLNRRIHTVKTHAAVNGVTGIVAGAGSLITSKLWWGYPILVPCIISSICCNYIWRHRIGYDRLLVQEETAIDTTSLVRELRLVSSAQQTLKKEPSASLSKLVSDTGSIPSVIEFIIKNNLFEDFCIRLLEDTSLSTSIFGPLDEELTIDSQRLLTVEKQFLPRLVEIAQISIHEMGVTCFQHRERYLLETIGCYLCASESETSSEKVSMHV